ncbi:MAG TPA: methyltransferase domain-containing protein, partial [Stellaceae bacterium]|nr:methyltransferase domain-containing protein [Stellaceae bacterium]
REPLAAELAAARGDAVLALGSVDALPFPDGAFAAIFSADVLYHRNVDEMRALAEFRRCLAPGGRLVVNLPAYDWMRSSHDEAVHGARRYTAGRIRQALAAAGFTRIVCRYWNFLLFPLMAAKRKLLPSGSSDVHPFPAPIEAVFRAVMRTETAMIRRGMGLPFGGSIMAAAVA